MSAIRTRIEGTEIGRHISIYWINPKQKEESSRLLKGCSAMRPSSYEIITYPIAGSPHPPSSQCLHVPWSFPTASHESCTSSRHTKTPNKIASIGFTDYSFISYFLHTVHIGYQCKHHLFKRPITSSASP